jgi:two-component sensor histidine kinase
VPQYDANFGFAALVIEIADDGVGLPEGFDPNNGKSTGFRVMRAAADQVRGRLSFEQTPLELCVRLELPAA